MAFFIATGCNEVAVTAVVFCNMNVVSLLAPSLLFLCHMRSCTVHRTDNNRLGHNNKHGKSKINKVWLLNTKHLHYSNCVCVCVCLFVFYMQEEMQKMQDDTSLFGYICCLCSYMRNGPLLLLSFRAIETVMCEKMPM